MTKRQKIIFWSIVIAAVILIFFRLGRQDMLSDDGHYAFRGLGYYDFVGSLEQTTPVQWFGDRPTWSYLSFHDHPPLFFLLQHIFFRLFGDSVVVSRFVSALAGLGSIIVMFFLGRFLSGKFIGGAIAAGALVVNSYFIWNARIGHLESLFIFFLLLGLYYFARGFLENDRYLKTAGLFFGLAFLSKYTLLFFMPALFLFLLWKGRQVFRNRQFWYGVLIFLVVISPVIIYNLAMYQARGHFDVQFSDLFGQEPKDWPILKNRIGGWQFDFSELSKIVVGGLSWPYFVVGVIGLVFSLVWGWRKKGREGFYILPALVFLIFMVSFAFIGPAPRWLAVMSPFAALAIGQIGGFSFSRRAKILLGGMGIVLAAFSLFYTFNTNHFREPAGGKFWFADFRIENYGYNQLDKKVKSWLAGASASTNYRRVVQALWYDKLKPEALPFENRPPGDQTFDSLLIYDQNMNWFVTVWIFERLKFYRGMIAFTSHEFFQVAETPGNIEALNKLGFRNIYYIHAAEQVREQSGLRFPESQRFWDSYQKNQIQPEIIYDDKGREAFYIYKTQTLEL